jgi:hypothetical protein
VSDLATLEKTILGQIAAAGDEAALGFDLISRLNIEAGVMQ